MKHQLASLDPLTTLQYKGFTITPRTYQIRGTGRWTLDLLIGKHDSLRAFGGAQTYSTQGAAVSSCFRFARDLIDSRWPHDSGTDLMAE